MRIGAIPETWLERIALWFNLVPIPLGDTHLSFILARTVMEATRLGIFETMADKPCSVEEVSAICRTDVEATTKLLNALTGLRYLENQEDQYSLTKMARKWLLKKSGASVYDKMLLHFYEWEFVERFGDYLRTGESIGFHEELNEDQWQLYQRGMRDIARLSASEVVWRTPLPKSARDMIDIGGSHAVYSVALCRRYTELRAVVLDLPEAIAEAQHLLAQEQMGDRVVHDIGDALTYDFGTEKWDVIFMSSLVHHFTEEENRDLTKRVSQALRPQGIFIIQDYVRSTSPKNVTKGGIGQLLDLYFATISQSGTWTLTDMKSWQKDAGLVTRKSVWLHTIPGHVQQSAVKRL